MGQELHKRGIGFKIAVSLTVIYLLLAAISLVFVEPHFWQLKLNEMGDALAGAFAPLAFAWLVLGFFQQGQELKQNTQQMKDSVEQFTTQSASMEETNELEKRKLSITEWDRIHLEMSGILSQYLYHQYNSSNGSKIIGKGFATEMRVGDYVAPGGRVNTSEFISRAWDSYSKGDKNTFFRTVNNHTKWEQPPAKLKSILGKTTQKGGRYLQLQGQLQALIQDEDVANNLLMTEEMIGVANFLSK